MEVEMWASLLQQGFSVAVASYLLLRMERRLEELTKAITELRLAIGGKER